MPLFTYKAVAAQGRRVRGQMEALNLNDLEVRLLRLELDLITGQPAPPRLRLPGARVALRERIQFCFHLEQLSRAGVPLIEALADLRDSTVDAHMRQVIASVVESIGGGRSLSQALAEHGRVFDSVFCALVRAGETAGKLPEVLRELTASLKREDELKAFSHRLMIYPAFVLLTTLAAIIVSLVYVVPELAKLFRSVGLALPLQTRLLMGLSQLMTQQWPFLLGSTLAVVVGIPLLIRRDARLAHRWDGLRLRVPLLGDVYRKIVLSRFAGLFAMMYCSGIAILDTLRAAQDVVGNRVLREGLERVERLIAEGHNLTAAFTIANLFPPLVVRMLRVGEHTGSLDQALRNVSYFYDRDVRESIERLQAVTEPLILLILGGAMLWITLAILGPIYDIITRLKV